MEDKHSPLLPLSGGNHGPANTQAFMLARQHLAGRDDMVEQCRRGGAQHRGGSIVIRYLDSEYIIILSELKIIPTDVNRPVTVREKTLILHYLLTAGGMAPTGKLVAFQELPEGKVYHPTFVQRTVEPIIANFGPYPQLLLPSSRELGGIKTEYGDAAVIIPAFSRVPIRIILWQGDEEFPSRGNVLFDSSITDYLPTEDIIVLCEIIAWKLVAAKRVVAG